MVPNSLGPGELIEKYGTDEQKEHYLPRLAKGRGALLLADRTRPPGLGRRHHARHRLCDQGACTRARRSSAFACRGTSATLRSDPQATLVGLAFRLFDPDKILGGKGEDIGITVALIPATHPGVSIGRRHLPSGAAFPNGPNWGTRCLHSHGLGHRRREDGGQGWRMLMECLAAGRAISLPSSATAGAKMMLRVSTAYARIRKQFDLPIGRMEGSRSRWPAWSRTPTSTRRRARHRRPWSRAASARPSSRR